MPQCYPANPKAVQFVQHLTRIIGICQAWINLMMMTESLPEDMRPFYQDIEMLIGLAELCTFTADSIEFEDATGTRCKVEFHPNQPYAARLFRWDDDRRGNLETTERWIQDDDGRIVTPERAIEVVNRMCRHLRRRPPHRDRLQVPARPCSTSSPRPPACPRSTKASPAPLSPNRPHAARRHLQQAL